MAKIIKTEEVPDWNDFSNQERDWIYNAFDCAITEEIFQELMQIKKPYADSSYDFVRAMQAPAMCMANRGILIDTNKRMQVSTRLAKKETEYINRCVLFADAIGLEDFNPRSVDQVKNLLYNILAVPEQLKWDGATKTRKVSVDRDCLEKIQALPYFYAKPFVNHILAIRETNKKLGVVRTGVDPDGRMRTSYNVSGTETGRWSSNENVFGTGTNLQNITDELREMFIADKGMKFGYIDGEQAESRVTAYISGDDNYIKACESGDIHTYVTMLVWPNLDWSKDDPDHNKKVASQICYKHLSFRDMSKKLGHGSNYMGKPYTLAREAHIDKVKVVEDFQELYFTQFKGIADYHQKIATMLQTQGYVETPLGRRRYFFGRKDSDDTLKEAIAFVPQSTIGELTNLGLHRVWREFDLTGQVQCLAQTHDAILIQFPDTTKEAQRDILDRVCRRMEIPVTTDYGTFIVPIKPEGVGWNWRKYNPKSNPNPDSLMSLSQDEKEKRKRTRTTEEASDVFALKLSDIS